MMKDRIPPPRATTTPESIDYSRELIPKEAVVAALQSELGFSLEDIRQTPPGTKSNSDVALARVAWVYCLEKLSGMSHQEVAELLGIEGRGATGGVGGTFKRADGEMARRVGANPIRDSVLKVCKRWNIDARILAQRKILPQ